MNKKLDMLYYIKKEKKINMQVITNSEKNLYKLAKNTSGRSYKSIVIYATGSSANAANSAKLFMQDILQMPVTIVEPSIAKSYEMILSKDTLYFAISQGGHSYSTIELVKEVQALGYDIYSITSDIESPIAKESTNTLDIGMGIEDMPFVTAGQTATTVFLWLIALYLAKASEKISKKEFNNHIDEIKSVVDKADEVIDKTNQWYDKLKDKLVKSNRFVAVSYGSGYGVVKEAETKFTETVRVPSHGHELEEYMHGPYIGLNANDYIFLVSLDGKLEERLQLLRVFLAKHVPNNFVISIGSSGKEKDDLNLGLKVNEYLTPILLTIPFHAVAWYLSKEHGVDLTKSSYPDFDEILKSKV